MPPKRKPPQRQVRKPHNIQQLITEKALARGKVTEQDLQQMLISLLYNTPDDSPAANFPGRGKLKLDTIMALHKINMDTAPKDKEDSSSEDEQLLDLLKRRQERVAKEQR